jgi:putative aldouronate transport system substrate-binding protein
MKMSTRKSSYRKPTRREFLRMMGYASGAFVLASCAKSPTPTTEAVQVVPTKAPAVPPTDAPTIAPVVEAKPTAAGCQIDWTPTFPEFTKYNPPVELKIPFTAGITYTEPDTLTNNPTFNRYLDQLGIQYTPCYEVASKDYYTRVTNDLAAGTLPDVFRLNATRIGTFVDDGALEDITDIFEATASDLVKTRKDYPDGQIWNAVKRDGRIYGIAAIEDGLATDSLAFIRQDWLDQLKLEAPKTLDEFTEVARAFKKAGLTDFPIAACQNLVTWQASLDPVFGAFGVMPGCGTASQWWIKNDDGTLSDAAINPAVKGALTVLNTWFTEGLIDPDFINKDEGGAGDAIMAGSIGIFFSPYSAGTAVMPDLYLNVPTANYVAIELPAGPDGKRGRAGTQLNGVGVVFRKGLEPKQIEAVIKQLNWKVELHSNWGKYQQYGEAFRGGAFAKGYEWDLDETECKLVPGPLPGEWRSQNDIILYRMLGYPDYQADIFGEMEKWTKADPASLNLAQKFILGMRDMVDQMKFYNLAYSTLDQVIVSAFKGSNTEAINNVLTDLLALEQTAYLEFITGTRPIDQFDAFVQEWMDTGGKVYTEEVNAWAATNK